MAGKSSAIPSRISVTIEKANGLQMDRSYDQALTEFGKAVKMIQQQRQLDRPLQDSKARCHINMGNIFLQRKDWDAALSEFSHSAGIYETLGKQIEMGTALSGMAQSERGKGQWEVCIDLYHQALKLFIDHKENDKAAATCAGMSEVYLEQQPIDQNVQKVENRSTLSPAENLTDDRLEALIEEKNEELRHFIRKAAHDMKEPLRMISSFGSLLRGQYGDKLGEGGLEFLDFITDANNRMGILLQKLLEYVKVGTSEAALTKVSLSDAIVLASSNLKKELAEKEVSITEENLPEVTAHSEYITQLFTHLIDNAVKYNTSEKPSLHISSETIDNNHVISFTDNGIGIGEEHLEKVFEIFLRLHSRSEYPGSGIGLATCEKIAQLYNGKMWVKSSPDKGATFYLSLPAL